MGPWVIVLISIIGVVSIMMCGLKLYFAYLVRPTSIEHYNDIVYL